MTPDPLLLEQRFAALQETLRLTSSPRARIARLLDFTGQFQDEALRGMFPAYAPEVFQEFLRACTAADFACTPPSFLEHTLEFFLRAEREHPDLIPPGVWRKVIDRLQAQQATTGEWTCGREGPAAGVWHGPPAPGAIWIPLVERERLAPLRGTGFACLRRLHIRVLPQSAPGARDEVHLHPLTDGAEASGEGLVNAVSAARATLKHLTGATIRKPLLLQCRIEGGTPVTGQSFEAGLAAALVTALAECAGQRRAFGFRNDVAITGRIAPDGMLLPVDEQGLALKAEACTWSWVHRLVVPRAQAERCRADAQAAAASAHPSVPPVQVAGVASLEELFFDRRITVTAQVPLARQATRLLWRNRMPAAMALLAAAMLLVARLLYGPTDRNPTGLAAMGDVLLVKNRTGETLDTLAVGPATATGVANQQRLAACADVDGDGLNEVVWGQPTADPSTWEVRCAGIRGDGPVWSAALSRHVEYQAQGVMNDGFALRLLAVDDLDADGVKEVIAIGYHAYFPSFILRLDAETGKEAGCYMHAGHLQDMEFADLDGDGITEILACGINNAYGEAALLVLDPRRVRGAGPSTPAYIPGDYPPAGELWYVMIPRTVVGLAVPAERYSRGVGIDVYTATRTFRLTVQDQAEDPAYLATIDGLFGFDMRPRGFDKASSYDTAAERLYREGRIASIPDRAYFDRFRGGLRYWNGSSWSDIPVPVRRDGTASP